MLNLDPRPLSPADAAALSPITDHPSPITTHCVAAVPPASTSTRDLNTFSAADAAENVWYCLHTQRKHEHIASAHLTRYFDIEVFCPRIRFRRSTRLGAVWAVESLFPSYIFAKFDFAEMQRAVRYAPGVIGLVHFGQKVATVSDQIVAGLRAQVGTEAVRTVDPVLVPGMEVQIAEGALKGLRGVLTQILPARERVKILLEFLGRTVETEVHLPSVVADVVHPLAAA